VRPWNLVVRRIDAVSCIKRRAQLEILAVRRTLKLLESCCAIRLVVMASTSTASPVLTDKFVPTHGAVGASLSELKDAV
jgi:hypothetical protein